MKNTHTLYLSMAYGQNVPKRMQIPEEILKKGSGQEFQIQMANINGQHKWKAREEAKKQGVTGIFECES